MNERIRIHDRPTIVAVITFLAAVMFAGVTTQAQNETTFTYQGVLNQNGSPVTDTCDLRFRLYDAASVGNQVGVQITHFDEVVTDGRFTVDLGFGSNAYDSTDRWLEIDVRCPAATGGYTTLSPRQRLTSAPHSIQTRGLYVSNDESFVGIGRNQPITVSEYFGFNAPITTASYGGMYISTDGVNALPFYGYDAGNDGENLMWHYYDGGTGNWHLNNFGNRLTVSNDGRVGVNNTEPFASLHVSPADFNYPLVHVEDVSGNKAFYVDPFGNIEIGQRGDTAAIGIGVSDNGEDHVYFRYLTSEFGYLPKLRLFSDRIQFPGITSRVLVGRSDFITSAEAFGVHAYADAGEYGGMYISTDHEAGLPFYGYAAGETADMWTYYDGATEDWHVYNVGIRMTVESSGQVGINDANPNYTLEVNGSAGKPGGGSWSNSSDRRLKKNINDLEGSLHKLLKLRGVSFEYIDPQTINELPGQRIGVVAQEAEQVFPDWVDDRDDGYKTVTYRGFEALTVEALRELRAEKDAQLKSQAMRLKQIEQQNAELKCANDELQTRFDALEILVADLVEQVAGAKR